MKKKLNFKSFLIVAVIYGGFMGVSSYFTTENIIISIALGIVAGFIFSLLMFGFFKIVEKKLPKVINNLNESNLTEKLQQETEKKQKVDFHMKEEFINNFGDRLIVDDKGLTYKRGDKSPDYDQGEHWLNNCYCPYGSLTKVETLIGIIAKFTIDGQMCSFSFSYAPPNEAEKARYKEAIKFIKHAVKNAPPAKAVNLDNKIVHKVYCNTCKKVFCYTDDDLRKNFVYSQRAKDEDKLELTSALGGTFIQRQMHVQQAQNYRDKIVNFSKCPYCGSTDVREVSDAEFEQLNNGDVAQNATAISAADELKKFKDLLDVGAITQEEFDAKKKQLLNL